MTFGAFEIKIMMYPVKNNIKGTLKRKKCKHKSDFFPLAACITDLFGMSMFLA